MWFLVAAAQANDDEGSCGETYDPAGDVSAVWAEAGESGEVRTVFLRGPEESDVLVTLTWRVTLGSLSWSWSDRDVELPAGTSVLVPVDVPDDAFLDDLAADYVADLLVTIEPIDRDGNSMQERVLSELFLAWVDGVPTVWDRTELDRQAPLGVVSDDVREELAAAGVTEGRVLAPTWDRFPLERCRACPDPSLTDEEAADAAQGGW